MKKKLGIGIVLMVMLVGCSGDKELSDFTENYNDNTYEFVSVDLLEEDDFENIRKEKYGKWKKLYEDENNYSVEAKYSDDDELTGYHIYIDGEQSYELLEGEGYEASQVIAETLGLDRESFIKKYSEALESGDVEYIDGDYEISFYDFSAGQTINYEGMTINYDKAS